MNEDWSRDKQILLHPKRFGEEKAFAFICISAQFTWQSEKTSAGFLCSKYI